MMEQISYGSIWCRPVVIDNLAANDEAALGVGLSFFTAEYIECFMVHLPHCACSNWLLLAGKTYVILSPNASY
jgi:hypothetical protein